MGPHKQLPSQEPFKGKEPIEDEEAPEGLPHQTEITPQAVMAPSCTNVTLGRKEIQAQIQKYKKEMKGASCSRERKKELLDLVRRLESEKKETGNKETIQAVAGSGGQPLLEQVSNTDSSSLAPSVAPLTSVIRAQKKGKKLTRWQKLDLQASEARQVTFLMPDLSGAELASLSSQLQSLALEIHDISPDGHCLFRSLSHQLLVRHQIVCGYFIRECFLHLCRIWTIWN